MSLPKSLPKTAVSLECAPFPPPSLPHPSSLSPLLLLPSLSPSPSPALLPAYFVEAHCHVVSYPTEGPM